MKSKLLLFSALLIHLFATAQVGKVELVADIMPGPGNASPQILGVVNNELIIGERNNDYMFAYNLMYRLDSADNLLMIGQKDSTYSFVSIAANINNTIYAIGRLGGVNNTKDLIKWDGTTQLPVKAIDSIMCPDGRIEHISDRLSVMAFPNNQRKLLINFVPDYNLYPYLSPLSISGYQAILDVDSSVANALPAIYYKRYPMLQDASPYKYPDGLMWMITTDSGLAMILEYANIDTTPSIYYRCLATYNMSTDSFVLHDFKKYGIDPNINYSSSYYMKFVNDNIFIRATDSTSSPRWLLFNGDSVIIIPETLRKYQYDSTTQYRSDFGTVNFYNQKYFLTMYDSSGNAWLGSYDPVTNTSNKIYNFRLSVPDFSPFTYYAGDLYFWAKTPHPSSNIFVFDGVNPPTLLDNIVQNVNITDARDFYVHNGSLYFSATDSLYGHQYGRELFKYTSPKAAIVKDVEPNAIRTLQVYPNPTSGVLQLEGLPTNAGNLQFQLYNTQGQRLATWEESITNTSYSVPASKLSHLAMGTYFIQVKSTQAPTTYLASFIKE